MVATRRGVRVSTPAETNAEQTADVPATPSTSRITRRTAKQAESPTQHVLVETSSQLEKSEGRPEASPPGSVLKRCSRAARLHSPELPCTPVGSVHEADMSDCSAVSDVEPPMTRTRGGRRQPRTASQEDEEISEVESCSSAVSSSKSSQSRRRSTRRKTVNKCSDPACVEAGHVTVDLVSESQRVTRSQRKTTSTRSSAKQQTEDSELSDAESCVSSVSGADFPKSTTRRPRRSMRQTGPIPIQLDEAPEGSQSPVTRAAARRAARGKAVDVSESQSCDSEGFESGPTYSMMTRRRGKSQSTGPKYVDSDSDLTDAQSHMGSPCKKPSRGTPCSSRTGSGSSIRSARASRNAVKECSIVLEKTKSPEEETSLNDSTLESTVIYQDADRTLLEEDENQTCEEKEEGGVTSTDLPSAQAETGSVEKGVIVIEDDPHQGPLPIPDSPGCAEVAVSQPAVTVVHQQEEPCAENKEDICEKETMQETIAPSEPLRPCESDTGALRESPSEDAEQPEEKDEAMEVADAPLGEEDAVVETGLDVDDDEEEEEKMEVSTLNSDAQQVVDSDAVQVESIQVTSSQQHNITAESEPEQPPKDVSIQNTKRISLLDSSDDEESEEEESKVSGEEEEEEEREGPSQKCEAAAASVDGLFMVDTRPGQEADDEYYKGRPAEEDTKQEGVEQEEDEEFVDEEGDDDDEDEDAELLFSGRDPQLKELSSRIDPGIRLKALGGLYINFDGSKSKPVSTSLRKLKEKKIQDEVMKKSVMGPEFEKKDSVPPYSESKQALKSKHRAEREKSTGDGWFNMKAPEITPELKADLQVLKMRGSRDPKRFYKKNDREGFPKYFQVGTVVDSPVDFYHSRVPKKARKRTMVEELLSDAEFRQNNKKKYQHIVTEKVAQGAGRKNKKKRRFHKK